MNILVKIQRKIKMWPEKWKTCATQKKMSIFTSYVLKSCKSYHLPQFQVLSAFKNNQYFEKMFKINFFIWLKGKNSIFKEFTTIWI